MSPRRRWLDTFPTSKLSPQATRNLQATRGQLYKVEALKQLKREQVNLSVSQFSYSVMSNTLWAHRRPMPGFPVHHQFPEPTQTPVHCVSDASQPSRPLSFPSPPAFSLSQHQGLFQWIGSSHQVAKVLELQHQSFRWILRVDFLYG